MPTLSPPRASAAPSTVSSRRAALRNPALFLEHCARAQGDVAQVRIGRQRVLLLSHPDLVKEVLVTRNRSFAKTRTLRRSSLLLGDGLFTSEGEHHLRQRRLVQPAFHRDVVMACGETMAACAARTAAEWTDGQELDAHREMMRLTLDVAGRTFFGATVGDEADEIGEALEAAMEVYGRLTDLGTEDLDYLPADSVAEFARARERLDATVYRMIAERRAAPQARHDVLSMLLASRDGEGDEQGMTDRQVRDEVLTLFLAGHETSANALAWTWWLLAENPGAEARMHAEIDAALVGRRPGPGDYGRLPYTRAVFAEAMRLYPPAWLIGREATEEVEIGGVTIAAGATVYVSPWVVQRDPRFFEHADEFRPERWLDGLEASLPRFAYFPFGAGPRKCIGEGFAWMEGVLILATLAQRWSLCLVPGQEIVPAPLITLRPKDGIRMIADRR